MKTIISLFLTLLMTATAWAQGGSGAGYDPTNPPDPEMGYRLTVKAAPEKGGTLSPAGHVYVASGTERHLSASPRLGYEFRAWMEGDEVVSTSRDFYYTMPDREVVLTAWFDQVEYNPSNPGDPFIDGYTHRVSVYVTPSTGGSVYPSNFYMREGDETQISAYPHSGFKFSCWKQDGKIISTSQWLTIKMDKQNLEYTAQFVYDPSNPGEPNPNSWNAATGELIMDHFSPDNLWWNIQELVGSDFLESVSSLTVIGPISNYDFGVVSQLRGLVTADFSRTSGCDWIPWGSFQGNETLTKVLLPASVTYIEPYAFEGCSNLSELIVYASMPPTVYEETFMGVPSNMVVKVYSSSLDLYSKAAIWSNYTIMPIDEESTALTVMLPDDATDGRYRNASLVLDNIATGQSKKLLVTGDRTQFVFGNLIPDMKYNLKVVAPNGSIIGSLLDFLMPAEGMEYKFESLLQMQNVSLALITPEGENVAASANISWFDGAHNLLGSGATLPAQVEGNEIVYEVSLPRELGIIYQLPEKGVYVVKSEGNEISLELVPFAKVVLAGVLTNEKTEEPVSNGYVTVSQTLNGFAVSSSTVADADGNYTLEVYDVAGTVTAGTPEHFESSTEFTDVASIGGKANFVLKPLAGTEITLALYSRGNIVKGASGNELTEYADYANVDFSLNNLTTGKVVGNMRLKYPRLIVLDGINDGDEVEITAVPKNSAFNAASGRVKIADGGANIELTFTSNGDLEARYADSEASEVIALLYDSNGNLLKSSSYTDRQVAFSGLPSGDYTLVSMMSCKLFSHAATLADLAASGLEEGTVYLSTPVSIETGYISQAEVGSVPVFDESQFYYTDAATSITVNKTNVTVGNVVTVRSKVSFLPEYAGRIGNVRIIYTIPEGCGYLDNSLLAEGGSTSVSDNRIVVEVNGNSASPRFCLVPNVSGEYRPSAKIEFNLDGNIIEQPIGSALFTAGDFAISVPSKTSVTRITARGGAPSVSEIKVYDNDMFIGSTRSLTNGDWRLAFDLYNPGDYSEHLIYAEIITPEGQKYRTSVAKTIYDKEWPEVTDIHMLNRGTDVDFNHIDATTAPGSYSYVPGSDMFTFKALFREGQAEKVGKLDFVILLSDGSRRRIDGKYLPAQKAWVCALNFRDINRLPVNVKVIYADEREVSGNEDVTLADNETESFRCPDVIPVIDPSGYVYEAVPTLRLPGVTATIFERTLVEDMYGELHENVLKWNAEDYNQMNPLLTDKEGKYQWDVPSGEWQVQFEKEGYETVKTDWLPVPPPQLDVNMGMTQMVRPDVKDVRAFEQAVEVEFDKYMEVTSLLNSDNVVVKVNGEAVEGNLSLLGEAEAANGEMTYAMGVRFDALNEFDAEEVTVMVSNKVTSYAGLTMENAYEQSIPIYKEVKENIAPAELKYSVGSTNEFEVEVLPAEASFGKQLLLQSDSGIGTVPESVMIDENGKAMVSVTGDLPGTMVITGSVEGSSVAPFETVVNFTIITSVAAPIATPGSGAVLYAGEVVTLSCETPDAQIWYTLDGTSPAESESAINHTEAGIVINDDTTIKAVAKLDGFDPSEEVTFSYTVMKRVASLVPSVPTDSELDPGTVITLSCEPEDAEIWYTLDGTSPLDSETRRIYDKKQGITINEETFIKAVAVKEGYIPSDVVPLHYTVGTVTYPTTAEPTASPEAGQVVRGTKVILSCETEGAMIYYTVDGSSPYDYGELYENPIEITDDMTIKAYASCDGYNDSVVVEFEYTVTDPIVVLPPYASAPSGSELYRNSSVELYCDTEGALILYTLDGSSPFDSETVKEYTEPIVIVEAITIKAVAYRDGVYSEMAEFSYTIDQAPTQDMASTPKASIPSGTSVYPDATVELSCATEGAEIWYTVDGSSPRTSETRKLYESPIVIDKSMIIRAVACCEGYYDSMIAVFRYKVMEPASKPEASIPHGSEVYAGTTVELSSETRGAKIWYTLDGTSPLTSETRMLYEQGIVITEETTILAVAVRDGYLESEVAEFHYAINPNSGIDSVKVERLNVVTLPGANGFRVAGVNGRTVMVYVFDTTGTPAMPNREISEDTTIQMDSCPPGVYVVRAVASDGSATLKFNLR